MPPLKQGDFMSFYMQVKKWLCGAVRRLYRVEVVHPENEPAEGGYLLCANHMSNSDVVVIAACMRKPVYYMAKSELFKVPLVGPLIRAFGAFPVKRGTADVGAIRTAVRLLNEGEAVGYFPQGRRYAGVDPKTTEIKHGAGLIVYRAQARVLPVFLSAKGYKIRMFRKTKLIIGKPVPYEELPYREGTTDEMHAASSEIFQRILELEETV